MTLPPFPRRSQPAPSPTVLGFLAALLSAACVKTLPPAPTPQAVVPRLDPAALPRDGTPLIVDVVEGPTPVQRIGMTPQPTENAQGRVSFRFTESPQVLCAPSPCAAAMPPGNVLLGFPVLGKPDALEVELVHIGSEPTVYRRSLSVYEDHTGAVRILGIVGAALGGSAAITGTALLPTGLAKDNRDLAFAGGITLGAGAALLALGIWAIRYDSPTYRPGSSNHFPLPPSPSASR